MEYIKEIIFRYAFKKTKERRRLKKTEVDINYDNYLKKTMNEIYESLDNDEEIKIKKFGTFYKDFLEKLVELPEPTGKSVSLEVVESGGLISESGSEMDQSEEISPANATGSTGSSSPQTEIEKILKKIEGINTEFEKLGSIERKVLDNKKYIYLKKETGEFSPSENLKQSIKKITFKNLVDICIKENEGEVKTGQDIETGQGIYTIFSILLIIYNEYDDSVDGTINKYFEKIRNSQSESLIDKYNEDIKKDSFLDSFEEYINLCKFAVPVIDNYKIIEKFFNTKKHPFSFNEYLFISKNDDYKNKYNKFIESPPLRLKVGSPVPTSELDPSILHSSVQAGDNYSLILYLYYGNDFVSNMYNYPYVLESSSGDNYEISEFYNTFKAFCESPGSQFLKAQCSKTLDEINEVLDKLKIQPEGENNGKYHGIQKYLDEEKYFEVKPRPELLPIYNADIVQEYLVEQLKTECNKKALEQKGIIIPIEMFETDDQGVQKFASLPALEKCHDNFVLVDPGGVAFLGKTKWNEVEEVLKEDEDKKKKKKKKIIGGLSSVLYDKFDLQNALELEKLSQGENEYIKLDESQVEPGDVFKFPTEVFYDYENKRNDITLIHVIGPNGNKTDSDSFYRILNDILEKVNDLMDELGKKEIILPLISSGNYFNENFDSKEPKDNKKEYAEKYIEMIRKNLSDKIVYLNVRSNTNGDTIDNEIFEKLSDIAVKHAKEASKTASLAKRAGEEAAALAVKKAKEITIELFISNGDNSKIINKKIREPIDDDEKKFEEMIRNTVSNNFCSINRSFGGKAKITIKKNEQLLFSSTDLNISNIKTLLEVDEKTQEIPKITVKCEHPKIVLSKTDVNDAKYIALVKAKSEETASDTPKQSTGLANEPANKPEDEVTNPDELVKKAEEKIEKISELIKELIVSRDGTGINEYYKDDKYNDIDRIDFITIYEPTFEPNLKKLSLYPYICKSNDGEIINKIKNIINEKLKGKLPKIKEENKAMEYLLYFILTFYDIGYKNLLSRFRYLTTQIKTIKYKQLFKELLRSTPYFIKNNWCKILKGKGNVIPPTCNIANDKKLYEADSKNDEAYLKEFKEILGLESRGGKRKTVKKINKRKSVNSIKKPKTKKKSRKKKSRKSVKKSIKKKRKTLRKR